MRWVISVPYSSSTWYPFRAHQKKARNASRGINDETILFAISKCIRREPSVRQEGTEPEWLQETIISMSDSTKEFRLSIQAKTSVFAWILMNPSCNMNCSQMIANGIRRYFYQEESAHLFMRFTSGKRMPYCCTFRGSGIAQK
jgi:hypothetical protein